MRSGFCWLLVGVLACLSPSAGASDDGLPRFTEEREAAAQFFVRKHLPELQPLLEELKKSNALRYELAIREIFQTTEYLAELKDDPRRHDLELKIAEFVGQSVHVAARDCVCDFVRFLNRIGGDGREILLAIPFASSVRIAEPAHDRNEPFKRHEGASPVVYH